MVGHDDVNILAVSQENCSCIHILFYNDHEEIN